MQAKDALCVAAVFLIYPGIRAVEYLGGDELIEWNAENGCPNHARTIVCDLQKQKVIAADVSASKQECY